MKIVNRTARLLSISTAAGIVFVAMMAYASIGDFYTSYTNAKVVAHLPLSGAAPQHMFLQQEGRKQYLYLQQPGLQGFTVVDVTKASKPKVISHVPQESLTAVGSGLAIAEKPNNPATESNTSIGSPEGTRGGGSTPETVRVLDVSDPAHPRTVESFNGVTSILPDDARGLFYVANGEGIWVLSHQQVLRRHECSSSDAISAGIPNCD
jgi:hypothetical protein